MFYRGYEAGFSLPHETEQKINE